MEILKVTPPIASVTGYAIPNSNWSYVVHPVTDVMGGVMYNCKPSFNPLWYGDFFKVNSLPVS